MQAPSLVHVVSHGPHCLDGVAAAVVVARFYEAAEVVTHFATNQEVDGVLQALEPPPDGRVAELWITDISWRERATDAHLCALASARVSIHWVDHHRTALDRARAGDVDVPLAEQVLSEERAAAALAYEHLTRRLAAEGRRSERFAALARLVALADDNDRWLHRLPGSRELAQVVRVLGPESYEELLAVGPAVTYTPRMERALARARAEIERSLEVAAASRVERSLGSLRLVAAVCDGYASEVADAWNRDARRTVFAIYDARSLAVSLRRSPDCAVDLSRVAWRLGGGGHPAAAGCELPELRGSLASALAERVAPALEGAAPPPQGAGRIEPHPDARRPRLTHLALAVADIDRSIAFYRRHCGLRVVHQRGKGERRVVWLSEREHDPEFVLVMFKGPRPGKATPTLHHLGFALASREEVDAAAAAGRREGILVREPADGGPIVGYHCMVEDPDGNQVEFSFGQPINPRALPPGT